MHGGSALQDDGVLGGGGGQQPQILGGLARRIADDRQLAASLAVIDQFDAVAVLRQPRREQAVVVLGDAVDEDRAVIDEIEHVADGRCALDVDFQLRTRRRE